MSIQMFSFFMLIAILLSCISFQKYILTCLSLTAEVLNFDEIQFIIF